MKSPRVWCAVVLWMTMLATVALAQVPDATSDNSNGRDDSQPDVGEDVGSADDDSASPDANREVESREADMFGEPTAEATPGAEAARQPSGVESAATPPSRDQAVLDAPSDFDSMVDRLAKTNDILDIGGLAFLRYAASVLDEGGLENSPISSPSFADVYFDARPSERLRFFARGRLRHDATLSTSESSVQLDQLWLKFDLARAAFFTIGRQRIKWGTGRFWNPTDFLNTETLDPLSVTIFDERLGVSLAKLHVPIESIGANLYGIATVDDGAIAEDIGGALRAELVVGTGELTASVVARRHTPTRMGMDYSGALGPVDVKLEVGVQRGVKTPFFRGQLDTSPLAIDEFDLGGVAPEDIEQAVREQLPGILASRLPESYSRKSDFIAQVVAGLEYAVNYTDDDAVYLGAEYFFNDWGYSSRELYPVLFQQGLFRPFYVGRHYAALYAALPNPGRWNNTSVTTSALGNLSDQSYIARVDYSRQLLTYLTFNAYLMGNFGRQGEFNYSYRQEPLVDAALVGLIPEENLAEIPPELLEGIRIVGPLLSVGIGLRMQI